ncbi:hypothetical protein AAG906_008841 [Vitis piasezkii]
MDSLLQEFDLQIKDKKGVENESLMFLVKTPWYAHIANYLVTGEIPKCMWRPLCLSKTAMKVLQSGFTWPSLFKDAHIMSRSSLLYKYGVKHKVATPYHPQTSGKLTCHLPVEVEYKAWWAIKKLNLDLIKAEKRDF